ncbi:MAG: hypothetical protein FJW34_15520 [Acidobacteria bacterium]|nr:hypothetical protein [Acidobacteriota bacterium]
MRTTVDIPDPTYRELKARAAREGCSVKALVLRGVQKELRPAARRKGRVQLPMVRSKEPGSLCLTNQQIYEIIPFP